MKLFLAATGLALLAMAGTVRAEVNLVTNGSFEAPGPDFSARGTYCYLNFPGMECGSLPGWTGTGPVILSSSLAWGTPNSPFGAVLVGLQGITSIQQALNLTAGRTYTLTWSDAGRDYAVPSAYDVTFGSQTLASNALAIGQGWSARSVVFVATGAGNLAFNGRTTAGDGTAFIDGVSLTAAVPEPASVALMLAGLVAVAGLARKRR
jgi:hypothetical protein